MGQRRLRHLTEDRGKPRGAAGMKHFVWAQGETILQYHGTGPWTIEYVNPEDDPRKPKK